jgi:hypothetical protein
MLCFLLLKAVLAPPIGQFLHFLIQERFFHTKSQSIADSEFEINRKILKPNLPPMKAVVFEVIFSLEARTFGSENKRAILENIALLFLRASRGKEFESDPFIGGKLGFK